VLVKGLPETGKFTVYQYITYHGCTVGESIIEGHVGEAELWAIFADAVLQLLLKQTEQRRVLGNAAGVY